MLNIKNKKAVFFDFGDTLASTVPTYPDRIRIALLEMGFEFSVQEYFSAFQYADYQIYNNYIKDGEITSKIYQQSLFSIIIDKLGINMEVEEARQLVNKKMSSGMGLKRVLLPGAEELLREVHSLGYTLAIISNNDGKTAEKCAQVGIDKYFQIIIDSTKVNRIKPDRGIYLLASRELGIDTNDIVHIGDLYGADVLGARNAGIETVWLNSRNGINYDGIDVFEVGSLRELSELFK